MTLLPVPEAQARLLAMAAPLAAGEMPVAQAMNRWLAADIPALRSQPATDLSAMDGYAIRFADMPGPWRIEGESAAGKALPDKVLTPGTAVRIFTGAALPNGADTVIIQEDVSRDGDILRLSADGPGRIGQHVRKAGSDFAAGHPVLSAGTLLSSRHVALAALAGLGVLPVHRAPRIAIVSSGSELVEPGKRTLPHQLPSSNAVMLCAMLAALPCEAVDTGIVPDDLALLTTHFAGLRHFDIVVTTGGASVGDHDLVKPALEGAGGAIDFWKIAMRPGKPLIAGRLGEALFLGLPGNPVSAFVTAHLFLLPLVRKMAGSLSPLPAATSAALARPLPAVGGREDYMRAAMTPDGVAPVASQDSAATLALSRADCLIRRTAGSPAAEAGQTVEILPI